MISVAIESKDKWSAVGAAEFPPGWAGEASASEGGIGISLGT
jgi:hypothetical protein